MVVSLGGGLLLALLLRGASDRGGGQWAASHQQPPPRPVAPGRVVGLVDAGPAGGVALPPAAGGVPQLGHVGLRRQLPPAGRRRGWPVDRRSVAVGGRTRLGGGVGRGRGGWTL